MISGRKMVLMTEQESKVQVQEQGINYHDILVLMHKVLCQEHRAVARTTPYNGLWNNQHQN